MRSTCAICAIVLAGLPGCFLSHVLDAEPTDAGPRDASFTARDGGTLAIDAATSDATIEPTSCTELWIGLPWCPADPASAIGQRCDTEGARCGAECCEPGPPIVCASGIWRSLSAMPDCSAVRCAGPTPCGLGACARDRVCLRPEDMRGDSRDLARCVEPASPIDSCGAAPPGSIVDDVSACMLCTCAMVDGVVEISLACACC